MPAGWVPATYLLVLDNKIWQAQLSSLTLHDNYGTTD